MGLPGKVPLPPENCVPEACGDPEFDALALVFFGRGTDEQGFRALVASNIGDIPHAFARGREAMYLIFQRPCG
jgi:hypothetical protein